MKKTIAILIATAAINIYSGGIPVNWTVETSRPNDVTFEAFRGETIDFAATMQSYGKPLAMSGEAKLYWQTNGMSDAYWEAPATVASNVIRATWLPEMDVGERVYRCFLGIAGATYRAAFQLRLRPSPGATPNALPLPVSVIDFAKVRVLNPPWPTAGGNAVLAAGVNIDTNSVAVLNKIAATFGGFPIEGTATTVGGLLAALAAAVAWLKKNKASSTALSGKDEVTLGDIARELGWTENT